MSKKDTHQVSIINSAISNRRSTRKQTSETKTTLYHNIPNYYNANYMYIYITMPVVYEQEAATSAVIYIATNHKQIKQNYKNLKNMFFI